MLRFLLTRLVAVVPTVLGITLLAFVLARLLPGDPVEVMLGERIADRATHDAMLARLGLDQPLPVQYLTYLQRLVQGDLGQSLVNRRPVLDEFLALFPATIELTVCALAVSVLGGVLLGTLAALRRGSWFDQGLMGLSVVGHSMPIYWWGLLVIMFCSVWMREVLPALALPVSGRIDVAYDVPVRTGFMLIDTWLSNEPGAFRSACRHLVLPAAVLGTYAMAIVARMTRSSLLETLGQDYVRTARAKGLSEARILFVHVLRNALIPVITFVVSNLPGLLLGAFLLERFFGIPGIGREIILAVERSDFPVIKAATVYVALATMIFNLIGDLLYRAADPRIQLR